MTPSSTLPRELRTSITHRYYGKGLKRYIFRVPTGSQYKFEYDAGQVPDRYSILSWDNTLLYTTEWAGESAYNKDLIAAGKPPVESPPSGAIILDNNTTEDYIIIEVDVIFNISLGEITLTLL